MKLSSEAIEAIRGIILSQQDCPEDVRRMAANAIVNDIVNFVPPMDGLSCAIPLVFYNPTKHAYGPVSTVTVVLDKESGYWNLSKEKQKEVNNNEIP